MRSSKAIGGPVSKAKTRQSAKLAEIRKALVAAGCDTVAKQAAVLGLGRSTTWALLNRDERTGPSFKVIMKILTSPSLSSPVREKFEQYVKEKIAGRYGHQPEATRVFRDRLGI